MITNENAIKVNSLLDAKDDYINITEIADIFTEDWKNVEEWLNDEQTTIFLKYWEELENPNFKTEIFRELIEDDLLSFESLKGYAKGISAYKKEGIVYAKKDIAIHFGCFVCPHYAIYLNQTVLKAWGV